MMDTLESLNALLQDGKVSIEKSMASYLPCLQKYSAIIRTMEKEHSESTRKEDDVNSKLSTLEEKLHEMLNNGNDLVSEWNVLVNANKDMLDKKEEKKEECQMQERRLASRRKAVSFYKERLSLSTKSVGASHMLFVFKNIDREHPEMCCLLQLLVEDRMYKVTKCAPELDVGDLLAELNASNDLCKFMVSVRKKFQQRVCYS